MGGNTQENGDVRGVASSSTDLAMAYVGTLELPGLTISFVYFIAKETGVLDWVGDKVSDAYHYIEGRTSNWFQGFIRSITEYNDPSKWIR